MLDKKAHDYYEEPKGFMKKILDAFEKQEKEKNNKNYIGEEFKKS